VHVWDTITGREKAVLGGPAGPVEALAFGPGDKTIAAGSADHAIWLWDIAGGGTPRVLRDGKGRCRQNAHCTRFRGQLGPRTGPRIAESNSGY
jgi:WD40 repeat protein